MKHRLASIAILILGIVYFGWDISLAISKYRNGDFSKFLDSQITSSDLAAALVIITVVITGALLNEMIFLIRYSRIRNRFVKGRAAWVLGFLASNVSMQATTIDNATSTVHSVVPSISPAVAVSVLAHIEATRRQQLEKRFVPDKFTHIESEELNQVRATAHGASNHQHAIQLNSDELSNSILFQAVSRPMPKPPVMPGHELRPWLVEVKLFGYPKVVSKNGGVAEFRKKRALELLTWLALNRDNSRRSAARTAMWDIDISDSAFSTVVSDMRRGLREIECNFQEFEWLPATYSDDLPLSELVITDADRLRFAHQRFKDSMGHDTTEMVSVLTGIRDVPFAGTCYSWADFDGTTTRLVISAVETCTEVAKTAEHLGRSDLLTLAVGAGLKVLPGCEELLELQDRFLSHSFRRRAKNDTHHFV